MSYECETLALLCCLFYFFANDLKKRGFFLWRCSLYSTHRIRIRPILVWKHFCLAMTHQAHLQRRAKENGSFFSWSEPTERTSFFTHLKMIQQVFADCIRRTDHHLRHVLAREKDGWFSTVSVSQLSRWGGHAEGPTCLFSVASAGSGTCGRSQQLRNGLLLSHWEPSRSLLLSETSLRLSSPDRPRHSASSRGCSWSDSSSPCTDSLPADTWNWLFTAQVLADQLHNEVNPILNTTLW